MPDLWDILDHIDGLTKALNDADVSEVWAGLSREERSRATAKLREAYLRIGNVLEEWNAARSREESG